MAVTGLGEGVTWTPIWLGHNTIGGVGIGANIGLNNAERDTVFFVDGDDFMIPDGFNRARDVYERQPVDIMIADYLEYDQRQEITRPPADAGKWRQLALPMDLDTRRLAAIQLIAVPWRKFYRTEFLRRNHIRFPEGDFFFEDNPFHWRVCLKSQSISFAREIVCHHRINRPGQTMASTGIELTAFFTHYRTIVSELSRGQMELRLEAARWLLHQMSWHIPRLRPEAFRSYAVRAADTLKEVGDVEWQQLSREMTFNSVWHYAQRLREGELFDVIEAWWDAADRKQVKQHLHTLEARLKSIEKMVRASSKIQHAQSAIDNFEALKAVLGQS